MLSFQRFIVIKFTFHFTFSASVVWENEFLVLNPSVSHNERFAIYCQFLFTLLEYYEEQRALFNLISAWVSTSVRLSKLTRTTPWCNSAGVIVLPSLRKSRLASTTKRAIPLPVNSFRQCFTIINPAIWEKQIKANKNYRYILLSKLRCSGGNKDHSIASRSKSHKLLFISRSKEIEECPSWWYIASLPSANVKYKQCTQWDNELSRCHVPI